MEATKASRILLQKHEFWQYEDECRIIVKNREHVSTNIVDITLDKEMDERMSDLVETVGPNIPVATILKRGLDVF